MNNFIYRIAVCITLMSISQTCFGSVSLNKQAVHITPGQKEPALEVTNNSNKPILLSAKINDLKGQVSDSMFVLPSLVKVMPNQKASFRVTFRNGFNMPTEEIMQRLQVVTIPARKKMEEGKERTITAQIKVNVAHDLPVIYHPKGLQKRPWDSLELVNNATEENTLLVNDSPYVIRMHAEIKNDKEEVIGMVGRRFLMPREEVELKGKFDNVTIQPINNFGYLVDSFQLKGK